MFVSAPTGGGHAIGQNGFHRRPVIRPYEGQEVDMSTNSVSGKAGVTKRLAKCLIAPAAAAFIMFGAHWQVFGSTAEVEHDASVEAMDSGPLPAAYTFLPVDYDIAFDWR
jgi:hypothetical protein